MKSSGHWRKGVLAAAWLTFGRQLGSLDAPIGADRQSLFYVAPNDPSQS